MDGTELANLMIQGFMNGLIEGAKIFAPYVIGFCVLCVVIGLVKRAYRKRKKK